MKRIGVLVCFFITLILVGCISKSNAPSSYEEIVCVQTSKYQQAYFSCEQYNGLLRLWIPEDWTLEKSDNGFNITKGSSQIGTISIYDEGETADRGSCEFTEEHSTVSADVVHNIYKIESKKSTKFMHSLQYSYADIDGTPRKIEINVNYEELDSNGVKKLMNNVKLSEESTDPNYNVLQLTDSRKKILILGNSFINTSKIGTTLQEMCGSSITVEAVAIGMAQVYTYVEDGSWVAKIKSGNYSAVFMCGLYGNSKNLNAFKTISDACETTNTKLAIFPAHNENRDMIDSVSTTYTYPIVLDWKNDIEQLIRQGVDVDDLCINDSYKHSTPLAGYVGAHMIYRAIFGKVPSVRNFSHVTQSEISKLQDYSSTGIVSYVEKSLIYYLN